MSLMHCERMLNYYPEIVKKIKEFPAMVQAKCPEMGFLSEERAKILNNAWMLTMDETRVKQWERLLGIVPLPDSTLEDRRETIAARVYGGYKLNTESIRAIVNIFTQSGCRSYFRDSTIYVIIYPPSGDKTYKFENVETELTRRKPAHLDINVKRGYATWGEIKDNFTSWQDVKDNFESWDDVKYYVAPQEGGN